MANEQMRPASPQQAPNPATDRDRTDPNREAGMGRLDNNMNATPDPQPDTSQQAVGNAQPGTRQWNGRDTVNQRGASVPDEMSDGSMRDDAPRGEDLTPMESTKPEFKRHPRTGGKGGTPDAGEPRRSG